MVMGATEPPSIGLVKLSKASSMNVTRVSAALSATLDVNIKPWSHTELSSTGVGTALGQLRAPQGLDAGVALGKLADTILELRGPRQRVLRRSWLPTAARALGLPTWRRGSRAPWPLRA